MSDDLHRAGRPDPNQRPCDDCGHVWFAGERSHEYVEHDAELPGDITVLCVLCRRRRGLARARSDDGYDH